MSTEQIDIRVREDGSRVVKRDLENIAPAAEKAAGSVDFLKRALGALAGAFAINKIAQMADEWTKASGKIRIATSSIEEATAVQNELFAATQRARAPFAEMTTLYSALSRNGKELGISQAQVIKFTEGVGKALAVQGVSAKDAQGPLLQLGQALGSGTVRAEEFNSILEGAPYILKAVADNIKGTDGSFAKLRAQMLDGGLTSKIFFEAFSKGSAQIEADFNKTGITIGQAFTVVNNSITKYIGELDQSLGLSDKFGKMMIFIADNVDILAGVLAGIGVAALVAFAPGAITAFATAVQGAWALLLANPFTAIIAALGLAITVLTAMRDKIDVGIDGVTTLGDVFRALGEQIVETFNNVTLVVSYLWSQLFDDSTATLNAVSKNTDAATAGWSDSYKGFYSGVGKGFAGIVKGVARTVDAIAGLLAGLLIGVARVFTGIPDLLTSIFAKAYNSVAKAIEGITNVVIGGINKIRAIADEKPISLVTFSLKDVPNAAPFEQYGQNIRDSIFAGFDAQGGAVEKWANNLFDRAAQIGKDRVANQGKTVDLSGAGPAAKPLIDKAKADEAAKALEKLKNELMGVLNTIAPLVGAQLEMSKAQDILAKSVEAGLISKEKEGVYLGLLAKHYKDILDPLGKYNRDIDEQAKLLGMSAKERAVEAQVLAATQDLLTKGVQLTEAEVIALRSKFTALQDLNVVVAAQDALLSDSVSKREAFATQLQAIQTLLADPSSGFSQTDATASLMGQAPDLFAGTQEAIDAQLASYAGMYAQIEQMQNAHVISFQTAEQMKSKVAVMQNESRLNYTQQFFGSLASLSKSGNSKVAAIGKAAAATQATIDGVLAVQKALASAPPPVNYALAAAVGAAAAANVSQILGANLGFMTGGEFTVGGSGGADSQMVAFRATPGEKVAVSTPTQVRKGDPNQQGSQGQQTSESSGLRIVNVLDPALVGDYLTSSAGERVLINTIERNSAALKSVFK